MRRAVAWIARFASTLLFRRVEVAGLERCPRDRPVLLVANHFNGFVDPVLIATALGRLPRFIAKAGLQRIPVAGLLLRSAGVVFVQRRVDTAGEVSNEDAFVECHRALAQRDLVAIFPEGTTHDRAQIDPLKTGAARIALGARAAGASDLAIVPVGLTFPDKVALRSSALVQFGLPIELDVVAPGGAGADDADAVRQLTGVIDRGIRAVSPDFPDVETALALDQAAQIALSSPDDPDPSLEERADLARRLGRTAPEEQAAVRREVGRYLTTLSGLRLTDADVIRPTNPVRLLRSAFWIAVLVIALGGLVAATALINVWPVALVVLVSLLVKTPVSKGTARALVGLIAFPTAWITAGVLAADGALNVTLVVVTAAVGAPRRDLDDRAGAGARPDGPPLAGAAGADRHGRAGRGGPRRRGRRGAGRRGVVVTARRHGAESDCEEIRPGLIGQPANTVSSLAIVAAALPIARAARRRGQPAWRAVALAAAVEGVGSVAYHGPGGHHAKVLHDAGLVALAATIGVAVGREGRPVARRPLTTALTAAAVTLHALSRTGGPLCSCRSPLQGHAVFHLLAAAALTTAAEGR